MSRKRPNILYVFADQMRSTALSCAGVEPVATPHLDRFGAQGTRFTNAVANTPVCSPSRATLLTGLHAMTHRLVFNDIQLRTDVTGIAHALNAAGYRCGYIGKWHLDNADRGGFIPPGPRRQGFDDFWAVANCNHDYRNSYHYLNDDPAPVWPRGYEPAVQTDLAIRYLQDRAKAADPFCLFLSWGPPHCPYRLVPQRYLDMYPPERIALMPSAGQADDRKRQTLAGYYAHVTALDDCFGRLMEAVDRLGLADDTVVVFSSDHGDMLFNHDRGWKCKPWRESVGVPLLVRFPGRVPAGRLSDAPVGVVDHMPSLLGLAGVPVPSGVEGLDLSALLCGDESAAPESQFLSFPVMPAGYSIPEWRGLVTRGHTYARFREGPWLLYDDRADPRQMTNLAGSPEHAGLRRQLDAQLQAWLARTRDAFEPSRHVADRLYAGHIDMTMPYYENETIRAGRQQYAGREFPE